MGKLTGDFLYNLFVLRRAGRTTEGGERVLSLPLLRQTHIAGCLRLARGDIS